MENSGPFRPNAFRATMTRRVRVGILIAFVYALASGRLRADTQDFLSYESATMGPAGVSGPGLPLSGDAFKLTRVHLDGPIDVMAIGGHLYQEAPRPFGRNDSLWGGIVALDAPDAHPTVLLCSTRRL